MGKSLKSKKTLFNTAKISMADTSQAGAKEEERKPITIDVIIPCHNSHDTLDRCLGSILCQRVLPSITVTLVRDGGEHYDDIIQRYSPVMNIQEIGYDDNGGPGKARNYGLTHTHGDVISFIDSDDCYAGPFAIIDLLNEMYTEPGLVMCVADFLEELAPLQFKRHTDDVTFVHGKLYKRSYLEKNKLLFPEAEPANEDVGFNILSLVIMKPEDKVKYIKKITHYWLWNPKSIVRSNKDVFDRSTSFIAFVRNMIWVFDEVEKRGYARTVEILGERIASMSRVINMYFAKTLGYPQYEKDNLAEVKKFYKQVYQPYEQYVTKEMWDDVHERYPHKNEFQLPRDEFDKFLNSLGE